MKFGTQCHSTKTLLKICFTGYSERCTKLTLAPNKGNFLKNKGLVSQPITR